MNICLIGTGYTSIPPRTSAATEKIIGDLADHFVDMNQNVTVVDIQDSTREISRFRIIEVPMPLGLSAHDYTHTLGLKHKTKRFVYSFKVNYLLKNNLCNDKIDILHIHNQYNGYFIKNYYANSKIPYVYTLHGHVWNRPWEEARRLIKINYWLEQQCLKKADAIIALNAYAKNLLVDHLHIQSSRIEVIGNGVNTKIYRRLGKDEFDIFKLRRQFAQDNEMIIIHVGSFENRKNQIFLIDNFVEINKTKPVKLLLVGQIVNKEYYTNLRTIIKSRGIDSKVHLLESKYTNKELNELYNIADVFVFPSLLESFGCVATEAMAVGIPVMYANSSAADSVSKTKNDMLRFDLDNIRDFLEKTRKVLTDDNYRTQLGKNGNETVNKHHSYFVIGKKHIELYESLIKNLH